MKKRNMIWLLLLIVGCTFNTYTMAKNPVANTPVKQSDYEMLHQGWIQVNTTVFNDAPCNLKTHNKSIVMLTECGAGSLFSQVNLENTTVKTPVRLQFYNVQQEYFYPHFTAQLANGNNSIRTPLLMRNNIVHRLEVSYE